MAVETEKKKATAGVVISLIAAILILLNAILVGTVLAWFVPFRMMPFIATGAIIIWAAAGVIFGLLVLIGSILIYMPRKEVTGGILVIIFSILSIIIGGGFIIGLILGIIGGALGITKKITSLFSKNLCRLLNLF